MANNINAITSGVGGVSVTGDTSGAFAFQKDGTTVASISDTGVISSNVPAFSAYVSNGSANQNITQSTFTKVKFDTEIFDTNNNFDSSTNYRFTPTVAGYYQINGVVYITGTAQTLVLCGIYKNGANYLQGTQFYSTLSGTVGTTVSDVIYMNGSTDYLELYAYSNGTSPAVVFSASITRFSGALVRAA